MRIIQWFIFSVFILTYTVLSFGDVYYVDANKGSDSKIGTSIEDAWKTITHALSNVNSSSGNPATINIESGTYSVSSGEVFPLDLISNISIIGKTDITQVIIDASGSGTSVMISVRRKNVRIEGITITGGSGFIDDSSEQTGTFGGGIFMSSSSPTFENCLIQGNAADFGGGIACTYLSIPSVNNSEISGNTAEEDGGGIFSDNSSPSFSNTSIEANKAESALGVGGDGGGLYCEDSSFYMDDCKISGNTSDDRGGGIFMRDSTPILSNCDFDNNQSSWNGGGAYIVNSEPIFVNIDFINNKAMQANGGALYLADSSPWVKYCNFSGNFADEYGGGFYCYNKSNPVVENSSLISNEAMKGGGIYAYQWSAPEINNCLFSENIAIKSGSTGGHGGAIFCSESSPEILNTEVLDNWAYSGGGLYFSDRTDANVINCLIVDNTAQTGGGIFCQNKSIPKINNCTIANNQAPTGKGIYSISDSLPSLTNCIIWGNGLEGSVEGIYSNVEGGIEGSGNINSNPNFTKGPRGDYYLSQKASGQNYNSPSMNSGKKAFEEWGIKDRTTRTDGVLDGDYNDMGYHYAPHLYFGFSIKPVKDSYNSGDNIQLFLDIEKYAPSRSVDLYFIMIDPAGAIFSGLDFEQDVKPLASNLLLPEDLFIKNIQIINTSIPSTNPPISSTGLYTFAIGSFLSGTSELISNVEIKNIVIE